MFDKPYCEICGTQHATVKLMECAACTDCAIADFIRDAGVEEAHADRLQALIEAIDNAAFERGKQAIEESAQR